MNPAVEYALNTRCVALFNCNNTAEQTRRSKQRKSSLVINQFSTSSRTNFRNCAVKIHMDL